MDEDWSKTLMSTYVATQQYVNNLIANTLNDRGNYYPSNNQFPSCGGSGINGEIMKGDLWTCASNGIVDGNHVLIGDRISAIRDTPGQDQNSWTIMGSLDSEFSTNEDIIDSEFTYLTPIDFVRMREIKEGTTLEYSQSYMTPKGTEKLLSVEFPIDIDSVYAMNQFRKELSALDKRLTLEHVGLQSSSNTTTLALPFNDSTDWDQGVLTISPKPYHLGRFTSVNCEFCIGDSKTSANLNYEILDNGDIRAEVPLGLEFAGMAYITIGVGNNMVVNDTSNLNKSLNVYYQEILTNMKIT